MPEAIPLEWSSAGPWRAPSRALWQAPGRAPCPGRLGPQAGPLVRPRVEPRVEPRVWRSALNVPGPAWHRARLQAEPCARAEHDGLNAPTT